MLDGYSRLPHEPSGACPLQPVAEIIMCTGPPAGQGRTVESLNHNHADSAYASRAFPLCWFDLLFATIGGHYNPLEIAEGNICLPT